ncbi:hypothetical protein ABTZ03_31020 [Kitasatospora sp. NPDC096077]|uniref:hypothetical protein n=1 Tax=Kitasatospora sp. NPDC096077 TaxID=3155544 RepID=UPI003324AD33
MDGAPTAVVLLLWPQGCLCADYVLTMGCGGAYPYLPGKKYLDRKLENPASQGIEAARSIRDGIKALIERPVLMIGTEAGLGRKS